MGNRQRQLLFHETLLPLTGQRFAQPCPFDGFITELNENFPSGCNFLMGVSVGHGVDQCFPMEGHIALDDARPIYSIENEWVKDQEPIWVDIQNHDRAFPHTIVIVITLMEEPD